MSNDNLRSEISNLERKVTLLLDAHTRLKENFEKISTENERLKEEIQQNQSEIANFQNQTKITKIVDSMVVGERDSAELKNAIDDYIKEIDKCIAHLGEA